MTESAITDDGGNRIALRGDLTLQTVRRLFDRTPAFNAPEVTVNLEAVGEADSAGLALLVHWRNRAHAANAELTFSNAPAQLRQMAKITGLEELFAGPPAV